MSRRKITVREIETKRKLREKAKRRGPGSTKRMLDDDVVMTLSNVTERCIYLDDRGEERAVLKSDSSI